MAGKKYKVSIITVVYNGAKTIEKTIQSVLRQSYKHIEYIIVDGLSTDGTQKVIEKYKDSVVCFISEKDNGIYDAMNKGIERATGEIIGIINSDDWYDEKAVEKIVDYFEQNEVGLVYGEVAYVSQSKEVKFMPKVPLDKMWYRMTISHPSVFVKKNVYEKYGKFDTNYKLASDYDFLLRVYSRQVKFGYIDDVIAYFRLGGASTVREKEMADETYAISMAHLTECPDKEAARHEIKEKHQWSYFNMGIRNEKRFLSGLLCQYFQKDVKEVVMFGTGIWGRYCCELLMADGMSVSCFVDNNPEKWGTEVFGIKVMEPEKLRETEAYVLIAVRAGGDGMKQQLEDMENPRLRCVSLSELVALHYENVFQ